MVEGGVLTRGSITVIKAVELVIVVIDSPVVARVVCRVERDKQQGVASWKPASTSKAGFEGLSCAFGTLKTKNARVKRQKCPSEALVSFNTDALRLSYHTVLLSLDEASKKSCLLVSMLQATRTQNGDQAHVKDM